MKQCDPQLLGAYHDGELPDSTAAGVEAHVRTCRACADELAGLRAMSRLFDQQPGGVMTADELSRLHEAIDESADRPILRIVTAALALAASVLIISAVWLADLSNRGVGPAIDVARAPEAWETIAITLKPTPADFDGHDTAPATADARLDEWMLQSIAPKESN